MADIHVHIVDGEETVYPEERIPELLRQGALTPETYYWRAGMTQWRPLSSFKPSNRAVVPERRTDALPEAAPRRERTEPDLPAISERKSSRSSRRFRFRRKPELLTRGLQTLLVLAFLLTSAELVLAVLARGTNGAPRTDLPGTLGWAGLGLDLVVLVLYCVWIQRANINCHGFSSIVVFKPAWAVGCLFVPVMNLVRPYQVMQEIWKVSANPRSWQNDSPSGLVGLWWTFWLLTLGLAEASYLTRDMARTEAALRNAALVFIGLKAAQAIWFLLFFLVITLILRNQLRLVKRSPGIARKAGLKTSSGSGKGQS